MFVNLFFVILVMLLISLTPDIALENSFENSFSSAAALMIGLGIYGLLLLCIYGQNYLFAKRHLKNRLLLLVNLELLLFLFFFHIILKAPLFWESFQSDTLASVFSLLLYFTGLAVFYLSSSARKTSPSLEIRLLIPFCMPFLFISLIFDLLKFAPASVLAWLNSDSLAVFLISLSLSLSGLVLMMILLPFFIIKIWLCQPLEDRAIGQELENLCRKAHFKHAGLKSWTVLNHSLTAAIVGITPKFRYILFTERLLQELPSSSIEAILAHEIGHSYHKHLLFIPLVVLGLSLCLGFFSIPFAYSIEYLSKNSHELYSSEFWLFIYPLAIFIIYAGVIALYFRLVFGLFSRLFERQADLHVFHLDISPQYMIEALNYIGYASGNSHRLPNWHHYSIQERIDFLQAAEQNPALIAAHHRKVKIYWYSYLILLISGLLILGMLYLKGLIIP